VPYPDELPSLSPLTGTASEPLSNPLLATWALLTSQTVEAIATALGTNPTPDDPSVKVALSNMVRRRQSKDLGIVGPTPDIGAEVTRRSGIYIRTRLGQASTVFVMPPADGTIDEFEHEVREVTGAEDVTFNVPTGTTVFAMGDLSLTGEPGGRTLFSWWTTGDGEWMVSAMRSVDTDPVTDWHYNDLGVKLGWAWDPATFGLADGALVDGTLALDANGAQVFSVHQGTVGQCPTYQTNELNGAAVVDFDPALLQYLTFDWDIDVHMADTGGAIYVVCSRDDLTGGGTDAASSRSVIGWGENAGWGGSHVDPARTAFVHRFATGQISNNPRTTYGDIGAGFHTFGALKQVSDDTERQRVDGAQVSANSGLFISKLDTLAGSTIGGTIGLGQYGEGATFNGQVRLLLCAVQELLPVEYDLLESYCDGLITP
jgi:hypothetical protein